MYDSGNKNEDDTLMKVKTGREVKVGSEYQCVDYIESKQQQKTI